MFQQAIKLVATTTQVLAGAALKGQVDLFLANASYYLDMLGHIVLAWIWLQQAVAAANADDGRTTMQSAIIAVTFVVMVTAPCLIAMRFGSN